MSNPLSGDDPIFGDASKDELIKLFSDLRALFMDDGYDKAIAEREAIVFVAETIARKTYKTVVEVMEEDNDYRNCDECGKVEDAGNAPDWVNGKCEECDPEGVVYPDLDGK